MSDLICNICLYGMAISASALAGALIIDIAIELAGGSNTRSKDNMHSTFY